MANEKETLVNNKFFLNDRFQLSFGRIQYRPNAIFFKYMLMVPTNKKYEAKKMWMKVVKANMNKST